MACRVVGSFSSSQPTSTRPSGLFDMQQSTARRWGGVLGVFKFLLFSSCRMAARLCAYFPSFSFFSFFLLLVLTIHDHDRRREGLGQVEVVCFLATRYLVCSRDGVSRPYIHILGWIESLDGLYREGEDDGLRIERARTGCSGVMERLPWRRVHCMGGMGCLVCFSPS